MQTRTLKIIGSLFILSLAILFGFRDELLQLGHYSPEVRGDSVDLYYIVTGLRNTTTFGQTLKWWYGPWVGYLGDGQVNSFYRPLTSLFWWVEWTVYGPNGRNAFMATHILWHVLACGTTALLLRRVLGSKIAIIAVALWTSCAAALITLPAPWPAYIDWHDDPEMTVTIAVTLCLWSLLSYWRTGKKRFAVAALLAQLAAISLKEMSYIIPLLAGLLLWYEWPQEAGVPRKKRIIQVAAMAGIVVAAYIFRGWALHGPGFRFGTNGSWLGRFIFYAIGGRPADLVYLGNTAAAGIASVLIGLYSLGRKNRSWGIAFLLLGVVLVLADDMRAHETFGTLNRIIAFNPAIRIWDMPIFRDSFYATAIIALWLRFFRHPNKRLYFGIGWLMLSYSPLLTAPITEHALYIPSLGWAIWLAVLLEGIVAEITMVSRAKTRWLGTTTPSHLASQP